jgi:hypothetical protein
MSTIVWLIFGVLTFWINVYWIIPYVEWKSEDYPQGNVQRPTYTAYRKVFTVTNRTLLLFALLCGFIWIAVIMIDVIVMGYLSFLSIGKEHKVEIFIKKLRNWLNQKASL